MKNYIKKMKKWLGGSNSNSNSNDNQKDYNVLDLDRFRSPITKDEYKNSANGFNIDHLIASLVGLGTTSWIIGGSNPKEITEIFGKHDFNFKGSEYNYKMWSFNFHDHIFIVYGTPGKGVGVESNIDPQNCTESEKGSVMIFANKLIGNIIGLDNDRIKELKTFDGLDINF